MKDLKIFFLIFMFANLNSLAFGSPIVVGERNMITSTSGTITQSHTFVYDNNFQYGLVFKQQETSTIFNLDIKLTNDLDQSIIQEYQDKYAYAYAFDKLSSLPTSSNLTLTITITNNVVRNYYYTLITYRDDLSLVPTFNLDSKYLKPKDWKKSLYLCLNVKDRGEFLSNVGLFSLKLLSNEYKEELQLLYIKEFLENFSQAFNFVDKTTYKTPPSFHVTTYFGGGKPYDTTNLAYKQFVEDKEIDIVIAGLVVVPNRCVASIAFPNAFINNEFPHITTVLGSYKAVDSNDVMKTLFNKVNGPLRNEYANKFSNIKDITYYKFNLEIKPTSQKAKSFEDFYVILFGQQNLITIQSFMEARDN